MKFKHEKGRSPMMPVKNFNSVKRSHCDNGCTEVTYCFNVRHVPSQALPGLFGIPTEKCLYIIDAIRDENIEIGVRNWMEDVFIKKIRRELPPELTEAGQRQREKDTEPVGPIEGIMNCKKRPSDVVND